jgi:purine-binding chemotaxis protein CheW
MDNINNNTVNSFLTFRCGKEYFAANVNKVLNILELSPITHVPKSPPHMIGVTNLRGSVLPVIDTRIKLNLPLSDVTTETCILVLSILIENEDVTVGALVDAVHEVVEIESSQILDPPNVGSKFKSEYINAVLKVGEQFIMLLDVDKIFVSDDLL